MNVLPNPQFQRGIGLFFPLLPRVVFQLRDSTNEDITTRALRSCYSHKGTIFALFFLRVGWQMRYRYYSISKSLRNIDTEKHCLHRIYDFRENETYGSWCVRVCLRANE